MSDWIEWKGGERPVPVDATVQVMRRNGQISDPQESVFLDWFNRSDDPGADIISYRIVHIALKPAPLTGGKLSGDHYYRVRVAEPISHEVQPYTAECADIIEALGMTFNEGEAFKALWRLAASRQGRGKPGNKAQYDADKAAHYGARVAAQTKRAAE